MAHNIEYFISLADTMIDNDSDRNDDFEKYEEYYNMVWDLPKGLKKLQWIRKIINNSFHDAVNSGIKTLSNLEPSITLQPLAPNMKSKRIANEREQVLKWELMKIDKRRQCGLVREMMKSAIMYQCIAATVTDLDHQIKSAKEAGMPTARYEMMRRISRFIVDVYNPRDVHVIFSNVMLENWLLAQVRTARDIYAEYGDKAGPQIKEDAENADEIVKYEYYYMWTPIESAVWASRTDSSVVNGATEMQPQVIIEPQEHGMSFCPHIWRSGADTLEKEEKHRYHPMGYALLHGDLFNTANVADSVITSKAILMATRATRKETGTALMITTDSDPNDPNDTINVTPGNDLEDLMPPQIDAQFYTMFKDTVAKINNTTLAKILSNPEVPAGTAYATINVLVMSALGQLTTFQRLGETALEDICERFLLYTAHSKVPMRGYGYKEEDKKTYGKQYVIEPSEIATDAIYVKVKLNADLPLDKMANIQAANQAVQGLDMSKEYALESIGIPNAVQIIEDRIKEKLVENKIAIQMNSEQQMSMLEIQNIQTQQQMALQAAQAAANPQGVPGAEGMNPAEGSAPPAMMNPNATREMQTGQTATGEQVSPGVM